MKQGKIIAAIKILNRLSQEKMPLAISSKIYRIRKALQPHWDWQSETEMKLINDHGTIDEAGIVHFTSEGRAAFDAAIAEISATEIDPDWTPITVKVIENLQISAAEIEALEGFVEFEEGESA